MRPLKPKFSPKVPEQAAEPVKKVEPEMKVDDPVKVDQNTEVIDYGVLDREDLAKFLMSIEGVDPREIQFFVEEDGVWVEQPRLFR